MIYHELNERHRYYCYEADAKDLVLWLLAKTYWFEYDHVSSGDDPAHRIECGVSPNDLPNSFTVKTD